MVSGIMQQGYAPPEKADLSKASVRGGKALTESKYSFQLKPYENGAPGPAPTLLQKEVSVAMMMYYLPIYLSRMYLSICFWPLLESVMCVCVCVCVCVCLCLLIVLYLTCFESVLINRC